MTISSEDEGLTMKVLKKDMTQEILKQYLNYDPATGWLTWKFKHCNKVIVGARAGSVSKRSNHRVMNFLGSVYAEHRLIWLFVTGAFPEGHIDHNDHDELNNRWTNLSDVTQVKNNMNSSKRKDNASGITGVWINKANKRKKFMAEMSVGGKRVYLKSFYSLEEAVAMRKQLEVEHGFHKNHGIVKPT
jgi:hypothetical protein